MSSHPYTDYQLAKKLVGLHDSADSRGIHFDMSFAHLKRIMRRKTCYYTGTKLQKSGENKRSIERVNNDEGYTDSNTVVVTKRINTIKNDLSLGELQSMVKAIEKHQNK